MKIALGTTSDQKREFVEEIINELGLAVEIIPLNVTSDVAEQPITDEETKEGSTNRARNAISKLKEADLALGIEIGYHPNAEGNFEMFCWVTLVDKAGWEISVQSQKLLLPSFHQQILKENKFLGDYVRQYLAENPDPISQHVGIIIRDRKPFIQTAVKSALLSYLVK